MSINSKKAVILLSGGLDSATCLAIAKSEGLALFAMSFQYGQKHLHELRAAEKVAKKIGVKEHRIVKIDLRAFGGSALTDESLEIPKDRSDEELSIGIPITYVPARNTIFLSYALAWAEVLEATQIFIGVNALDYSGYPDCRPEFIQAFQSVANLATRIGTEGEEPLKIRTPLIDLTKAQIVEKGLSLGVDYGLTSTCYEPDATGRACGGCDACILRKKGFHENGLEDPIDYVD